MRESRQFTALRKSETFSLAHACASEINGGYLAHAFFSEPDHAAFQKDHACHAPCWQRWRYPHWRSRRWRNPTVWYAWSPKPDKLPALWQKQAGHPPARDVLAKHKGRGALERAGYSHHSAMTPNGFRPQPGDKSTSQLLGRRPGDLGGVGRPDPLHHRRPAAICRDQGLSSFRCRSAPAIQYGNHWRQAVSLRFEVTHAGILPLYAGDQAKPADAKAGNHYMKVSTPTQPDRL